MSFRSTLASLAILLTLSVPTWAQQAASPTQVPQDAPVDANYRAQPDWMPKPDPGKGLVIVFRERRFVGGGVSFKLFYDDKSFPKLKNGSFVYVYLAPGDYQIHSDFKKRRDARLLEVEAGETYFFEATLVTGMWKSSVDLLPTDAETAQARMATLRKPALQAGGVAAVEVDDAQDSDADDSSDPEAAPVEAAPAADAKAEKGTP